MLEPAGIYVLRWLESDPPKPKIMICICPVQRLFMVINTDPRRRVAPETQLQVSNFKIHALWKPVSYIDTSRLSRLSREEVEPAVGGDAAACKGVLSPTLRARIVECVTNHGILVDLHEELVRVNLA